MRASSRFLLNRAVLVFIAVIGGNVPDGAHSQPPSECRITNETVDLELPGPGDYWFTFNVAYDRVVYMRPVDVVDYWRHVSGAPDLELADVLASYLPLESHTDVEDVAPNRGRVMVYMAADLIQAGKAAFTPDGERFLKNVLVEHKSGPPCNFTRDFYELREDGTREWLFHITDFLL